MTKTQALMNAPNFEALYEAHQNWSIHRSGHNPESGDTVAIRQQVPERGVVSKALSAS
jgi:hypothetical protein